MRKPGVQEFINYFLGTKDNMNEYVGMCDREIPDLDHKVMRSKKNAT